MEYPIILKSEYLDRMTDREFFHFCQENGDLQIERTKEGEILIMSPMGGRGGTAELEVARQLANWSIDFEEGKAFGPNNGFLLPDGSMLAPDASWAKSERWAALEEEEKEDFPPICPDFIMEVRSKSDGLRRLQRKMVNWIENGVLLGWLIDPKTETIFIYRPNHEIQEVKGFVGSLSGGDFLPGFGFALDLDKLKIRLKD